MDWIFQFHLSAVFAKKWEPDMGAWERRNRRMDPTQVQNSGGGDFS